jgi:hypothetical protein
VIGNEQWAMKSEIRRHYRLEAWKESITLVKSIYEATKAFPKEETFGLASQMRRAAISVPLHISGLLTGLHKSVKE